VLRQVVVHDQDVLALLHPLFRHRAAGERRQVLQRGRVGRRCGHDDGVRQRAIRLQHTHQLRHLGSLLADTDVDAEEVSALLVDDRVDGDRRLAGAAVADDQLSLSAPHRDHAVDRLDAGLHRRIDRLPRRHVRRRALDRPRLRRRDRALAVDRRAQRVDDAAQQRIAHRHLDDAARGSHLVAFLDLVV
jgi:hypothetical protein